MTRARVAAAVAALLTALLLQATLVGPFVASLSALRGTAVSLPAVLVASVALVDGPGSGLALGFATGLIADLGSEHPAGVLALCWLAVGIACGACASPGTSIRRDAGVAALVCSGAGLVSMLMLTAFGADGATVGAALRLALPAALLDLVLALGVVPLVRAFLRTEKLRAPRPVLVLGGER